MEQFIIFLLGLLGIALLFTYKMLPRLKKIIDAEKAERHVRDRFGGATRERNTSDFIKMTQTSRRSAIDQETREACDSLERKTDMVCTIMQSVVRDVGGRGWFISDALLASKDITGDAKEYLWKVTGGRTRRKGRI